MTNGFRLLSATSVTIVALGLVAGSGSAQQGRRPEWPVPSIVDYRPRSTLVVPAHPVTRAKYPAIDVHSHHTLPLERGYLDRVKGEIDAQNIRLLVNLSGESGDRLRDALRAVSGSTLSGRMVFFANIDFSDVRPGFGARAAAILEEDVRAGAVGLKIFKSFGLTTRWADGRRLRLDDPELDPVWATCARLGIPVAIHAGEPASFFETIDLQNERWLEQSLFSERRYQDPRFPRYEELMAERNRLFERHQDTTFIVLHMGYHANDLARLGALLDRLPNLYVETAAVLAELGRQPRAARQFFTRYQDRVMFGKDSYVPDEYPYYWRTFETADEYFDYYRDYHAFWKLYGMELPNPVLQKLYATNAERVIGIARMP